MELACLGAALEVTGSCHLLTVRGKNILLDCGMIQGMPMDEARNREDFPFDPARIDAVILSHAHIDHSGRLPLLVKRGFRGPIHAHRATYDLCKLMLLDAAYLAEKDAEWDTRKRERKGLGSVEPLYTAEDAQKCLKYFKALEYDDRVEILPGVTLRLQDAGHILGSSILELWLDENGVQRKLVFSGDLGNRADLILNDPTLIEDADLVIMESTYGDRDHRPPAETLEEIHNLVNNLDNGIQGNILIPSFAVGRTQNLLYLLASHYEEWRLDRWHIFLDSPLGINATAVYNRYGHLYNEEAARFWSERDMNKALPNLHFTCTPEESAAINKIRSGAIIIAGSGMCNGGRIRHHLKHNLWRPSTQVVIVGYQAAGTLGRRLVEGAKHVRLWGETIKVNARIHTIGGLSAHAGQSSLLAWYDGFRNRPPVVLVHGEPASIDALAGKLRERTPHVHVARPRWRMNLANLSPI